MMVQLGILGVRNTWGTTLTARQEPTTNSTLNGTRLESNIGPHWWDMSSLTTVPTMLSKIVMTVINIKKITLFCLFLLEASGARYI